MPEGKYPSLCGLASAANHRDDRRELVVPAPPDRVIRNRNGGEVWVELAVEVERLAAVSIDGRDMVLLLIRFRLIFV